MGSFNLHCSISHLTIGCGDKYVLLPLKKKERHEFEIGTQFEQIFQAFPPIAGEYDDYGRMDNVEIPAYYQQWEHGQAFIKTATDDWQTVPDGFNYTVIRREVWDLMSGVMCADSGRQQTAYESGDLSAEVLVLLGFVEGEALMKTVDLGMGIELEEPATRYNRKFTHPRISTHYIMSDGTWIRLYDVGTNQESSAYLYHPKDLCEMFPQIDASGLSGVTVFDLNLKAEIKKAKLDKQEELIDFAGRWGIEIAALQEETKRFSFWQVESHLRLDGVLSSYKGDFEGQVLDEIAKLYAFLSNCSWNGVLLTPGLHGPQLGNHYGGFQLAEVIYSVAKNRLDEYKYDMGID